MVFNSKNAFLVPDRAIYVIISLFFATCIFFSALIPPFQSPDEYDHVKRAYLLSKGVIILENIKGSSSGGMVDTGLLSYMQENALSLGVVSSQQINKSESVMWTGVKKFSPTPGTGYYFPLLYLPQAIGLAVGEQFGLSVDSSYHLARFVTIISVSFVMFFAFRIYPTNPLALALILMPMSIFQFATLSLDGTSTAISVFCISAFLKLNSSKSNESLFYVFAFFLTILVMNRVQLLPLLILILAPYFQTKDKKYPIVFLLSSIVALFWLKLAIGTTVDLRVTRVASSAEIMMFYLIHPHQLLNVFWNTLSNISTVKYYAQTFFGVLGWLDAPFTNFVYSRGFICLFVISLLSVSIKYIRVNWRPRLLLVLLAVASILMVLLALLVAWAFHPAKDVQGVQGRYFIVPAIMLSYAIAENKELFDGVFRKISMILVCLLWIFTIVGTTKLLLNRYYISQEHLTGIAQPRHPNAPSDFAR